MRAVSRWLCSAFLLLASCGAIPALAQDEAAAVVACFERYKAAMAARDAAAARALVTPGTLAFDHALLQHALHSSAATIVGLRLVERVAVLGIRQRFGGRAAELARLTPAGAFDFGVRNPTDGGRTLAATTLDSVQVAGGRASARLLQQGKPTPLSIAFQRAPHCWLRDAGADSLFIATTEELLTALRSQAGMNDEQLLAAVLEAEGAARPGPEIWRPLLARPLR